MRGDKTGSPTQLGYADWHDSPLCFRAKAIWKERKKEKGRALRRYIEQIKSARDKEKYKALN